MKYLYLITCFLAAKYQHCVPAGRLPWPQSGNSLLLVRLLCHTYSCKHWYSFLETADLLLYAQQRVLVSNVYYVSLKVTFLFKLLLLLQFNRNICWWVSCRMLCIVKYWDKGLFSKSIPLAATLTVFSSLTVFCCSELGYITKLQCEQISQLSDTDAGSLPHMHSIHFCDSHLLPCTSTNHLRGNWEKELKGKKNQNKPRKNANQPKHAPPPPQTPYCTMSHYSWLNL